MTAVTQTCFCHRSITIEICLFLDVKRGTRHEVCSGRRSDMLAGDNGEGDSDNDGDTPAPGTPDTH